MLSISLGWRQDSDAAPQAIIDALAQVKAAGALVVAAAGNGARCCGLPLPDRPGNLPWAAPRGEAETATSHLPVSQPSAAILALPLPLLNCRRLELRFQFRQPQ